MTEAVDGGLEVLGKMRQMKLQQRVIGRCKRLGCRRQSARLADAVAQRVLTPTYAHY